MGHATTEARKSSEQTYLPDGPHRKSQQYTPMVGAKCASFALFKRDLHAMRNYVP
jgi:hypothetical protein